MKRSKYLSAPQKAFPIVEIDTPEVLVDLPITCSVIYLVNTFFIHSDITILMIFENKKLTLQLRMPICGKRLQLKRTTTYNQ